MLLHPRGDMSGWDEFNLEDENVVPANALKLSGGHYILNNTFGNRDGSIASTPEYSYESPIRNFWQSNDASQYDIGKPRNFGYASLYENKPLRQGIARLSDEFNIPGRWLADSFALLTRGTIDPLHSQGGMASGLLAKNPKQIASLGISPYDYATGDIETQIEAARELLKRQNGIPQRGVEHTFTTLLNPNIAEEALENPRSALSFNNGTRTLYDMWNSLGAHQDIAYDHSLNSLRKNRLGHVHDTFSKRCAVCAALQNSQSDIVPHEFYGE